jgi:ribonuclease E
MLIDAAHAEETRVAVVDGNRVEEFDFESRAKKQLRGNIYLAKVTRVEPSLQAAFVEYGGNRHGFLAFNEVHPDYYQIPLADREALLREEAEENERHQRNGGRHEARAAQDDAEHEGDELGEDEDDVMDEEVARRRRNLMRRYKIQEVIKRRQIMLVQVVKDERGGKGASLTTYLSLAGRYCVLMPNTARGGGVSRKITAIADRRRLKEIIHSLDVPEGMGLIVRTAGAKRTKAEIKRDYEYLMRLWENIRDVTMKSIAPALIYEEEDLVKRAIRDLFDKDIDSVEVEGEEGYKEARDFMRMIMPSQAKKVVAYREPTPLFVKHRIEDGLAQIYSPIVPLRSGGYLVINQTEALVAIDVNSGKATRERNIESTALKTNMEAAEEAARQLRLRDLAGLIVIDFIDMDEGKNNRAVEKKLKDSLKDDRARIQMGRISSFGLMELSRQRRRTGVLEGTTHVCEHCQGSGRIRSAESSALAALRAVEIEAARHGAGVVELRVAPDVALYVLNQKRAYLTRLQQAHGLFVAVRIDDSLNHSDHQVHRTSDRAADAPSPVEALAPRAIEPEPAFEYVEDDEADEDVVEADAGDRGHDDDHHDRDDEAAEGADGRRRRRRRRRGGRRDEAESSAERASDAAAIASEDDDDDEGEGDEGGVRDDAAIAGEDEESRSRRRRRRGRRGGRRGREEGQPADSFGWTKARTPDGADPYGWYETAQQPASETPAAANDEVPAPVVTPAAGEPARRSRRRGKAAVAEASAEPVEMWVELPAAPEPAEKPKRARGGRSRAAAAEAVAAPVLEAPVEAVAPEPEVEAAPAAKPARRSRKKVETAVPVSAPEPEAVVEAAAPEPEPAAELPAEPDPAEISAPPAKPKLGWWRRG